MMDTQIESIEMKFDVSEVQRKTILGDVEFDMRTGEWELIRGNEKLENYSVSETIYWYDFPQKLATEFSGSMIKMLQPDELQCMILPFYIAMLQIR